MEKAEPHRDKIISLSRAAELSGLSEFTIRNMVGKGFIKLVAGWKPARIYLTDLEHICQKRFGQLEHGGKPALYTKQTPTFNRRP